jgi:hypothetical protein
MPDSVRRHALVPLEATEESVTTMTTTLAGMTVLGWLRNAGITEERARMHLAKGHVYADGVRVSAPDAPLAGAKIDLRIPVNRD